MCGDQKFRQAPPRDEDRASPASLDILMNVSMHILAIYMPHPPYSRSYP